MAGLLKNKLFTILYPNKNTDAEGDALPRWETIKSGPLKGREMLLNGRSEWQREMITGEFDSEIFRYVEKKGISSGIVWDVGAHIGYHALSFASIMDDRSEVFAFEPNPENVSRLKENIQRNKELIDKISVFNFALSDKHSKENFLFSKNIDTGQSSGSHLASVTPPSDAEEYRDFFQMEVETRTGDEIILQGFAKVPDIIKIDVEGAEFSVINGLKETIQKRKPTLFIELHNIVLMHNVQKSLFNMNYNTKILNESNCSLSRCLLVAEYF